MVAHAASTSQSSLDAKKPKSASTAGVTKPAQDACAFLDADHKAVKKLFLEYEEAAKSKARNADATKEALARKICRELTAHATVEEEIFYPAVRAAINDDDMLNEAEIEHASAKDLIAQIEASDPSDDMFDSKVKVLGEYIDHHVKEERNEMFPEARSAKKLDLFDLRNKMAARKAELLPPQPSVM